MLDAIIIEDESKNLIALKHALKTGCSQINLVAECGSVIDGRVSVAKFKPDIIFLDINLSDGNAFDLLEFLRDDLPKEDFDNLSIIFITALNQFAIKAFRFSAIDYLLKPVIHSELNEAVKKVEQIKKANNYRLLLDNLSAQIDEKKICLSTLNHTKICSVHEIVRCESEHNYTTFYFINDKPLMVSKTLKEYEDILNEFGFERIHQSHLINIKYLKSFLKKENGFVLMKDGSEIPVSRRKKEHLLAIIKAL